MGLTYPVPLDIVTAAYDGSIAVEVGDLMFYDTDDAKPAASQADAGSEAANQAAFAPKFLGVSCERKLSTAPTDDIDVAVDAIREMPCASEAYEIGDMVTVDEAASGTALENQKLVKTTDVTKAIGYAVKRYASATTTVLVRLMSNVCPPNMTGVGAIETTTIVGTTSVTTPVVAFSGATGANEIRVPTNLADGLSIEDSAGDLIVITTTTGSQRITFTPATTFTGLITSNGGVAIADTKELTFGTAKLARAGNNLVATLPTTDPAVAGALWNDSGTVKVSAGT
jgi:hypothetical protein